MKKFVLFFILSLLLISFGAFLLNAFNLQKDYFNSKNDEKQQDESEMVNDMEQIESYYVDYTKEDYEKALAEKRVLVLYFTSNWCEECKAQDLINNEVFNDLTLQGIVGLKIHILDSETTTETDALAKKYDVTKEQSVVIVDTDGVTRFKYVGIITQELLTQKILEVKQ
ncbi:MAG: thioredoxin domain-containing protein [Patescibacteria group bacterium]